MQPTAHSGPADPTSARTRRASRLRVDRPNWPERLRPRYAKAVRYVEWVARVLNAVLRTEDGRGGAASFAAIGAALGLPPEALRFDGRPAEGSAASSLVTALSDLHSENWIEFTSVVNGARSLAAGRDVAGRGVSEQWVRWFEDIYLKEKSEVLLKGIATASERQGPAWADAAWVQLEEVYRPRHAAVEPDRAADVMTKVGIVNDLAGKQLVEARMYAGASASVRINYRGMVRASERPQILMARRAGLIDFSVPSPGWEAIEDRLQQLIARFSTASELDDFQDVGRRSRELLIDLANNLFDPAMVPAGQSVPGSSDAKAKLELYFNARFAGGTNADLRAFMKKTHALANAVAHSPTVGRAEAYACARAMVLLVRVPQMWSGAEPT